MSKNLLHTDNRFELIAEAKKRLIEATNIESDPKEMAVIDNILFRVWQMGWLDKALQDAVPVVRCVDCKHYEPYSSDSELGCVIGVCEINPFGKSAFAHWYCADGERKEKNDE